MEILGWHHGHFTSCEVRTSTVGGVFCVVLIGHIMSKLGVHNADSTANMRASELHHNPKPAMRCLVNHTMSKLGVHSSDSTATEKVTGLHCNSDCAQRRFNKKKMDERKRIKKEADTRRYSRPQFDHNKPDRKSVV